MIVRGDEVRLEQVVHNLVGNAIKYSPAGGTVSIELTSRDDQVCLAIRDQGRGIPPDALRRIFQRFSRIHTAQTEAISGLGLGLYVVNEILVLHGGTVEVASVEGQGSTFTVCLSRQAASTTEPRVKP